MEIDQNHPYHSLEKEEVIEKVEVGGERDFLPKRQVSALDQFGENKLPEIRGYKSLFTIY
jgi:hypothetical protein